MFIFEVFWKKFYIIDSEEFWLVFVEIINCTFSISDTMQYFKNWLLTALIDYS